MMDNIFSRYASALVSIAKDEQNIEEYKSALTDILSLCKDDENVPKILSSYFVDENTKNKVIDKLTSNFELKNLNNFLKLLVKKHLINKLNEIVKAFNKLANEQLNVQEGIVYSATKLDHTNLVKITKSLEDKMGQKIELKNIVDTSLIGGVKVIIGDRIFDGSIKFKLERMKNSLLDKGGIEL